MQRASPCVQVVSCHDGPHRPTRASLTEPIPCRQWRDYLKQITPSRRPDATANEQSIGRQMSAEEIEALSDEQKVQLLKIHESIR